MPFSTNQAAVTNANATNGTFHGALDIAAMDGPWRFTNGAVMQIESGQAGNGGNTASFAHTLAITYGFGGNGGAGSGGGDHLVGQ